MTSPHADDYRTLPIRQDLAEAIKRAWQHLAGPGTWWTGEERLLMVAEARNARHCPLCRQRKAALSPHAVSGSHNSLGKLPDVVVDVVHRLRTDAGRLTEGWLQQCLASGLTDAQYVEIVGVVATITALDTFDDAIGAPPRSLPEPLPGEPTHRRPKGAKKTIAWVPTLAPEDLTPDDVDPFVRYGSVHIQRALSLVPNTVIGFFDLDIALYLSQDAIRDFANEYRAISHSQLEFIATKASALNGCYYCSASHAAVLRASGKHAGEDIDLDSVVDRSIESGVPHGELLSEFLEAALGEDRERLRRARAAVGETLGSKALIDTAAAVASFNAVVKVASGSGIVLEDFKIALVEQLPAQLREHLGSLRRS